MKTFSAFVALSLFASAATAVEYEVSADQDFEAECLHKVQPGDSCLLLDGDHNHDGLTITHGEADARITIRCESHNACIKGSNTQDRALQIAHDYYTIEGCCFDGSHGGGDYVATAIYVLGADKATTKQHGIKASVTGTEMFDLDIRNWDQECIHLRYFVTFTEIRGCVIQGCGKHAFENGGGGAVGEAVYVGTALDQVDDGKTPEVKLRKGGADNVKADITQKNWIHQNTFRTEGNECVDIKEGSTLNLVENNICEDQRDENSGCFGSRGTGNTFRYNSVTGCVGAGVRVGGDNGYGEENNIYDNIISECDYGAFNVMAQPQGKVCGNQITDVETVTQGAEKAHFVTSVVSERCTDSDAPGDIEEFGTTPSEVPADSGDEESASSSSSATEDSESASSSTPVESEASSTTEESEESESASSSSTPEESETSSTTEETEEDDDESVVPLEEETDDDTICAGVNCLDQGEHSEIIEIETNASAGTTGHSDHCGRVLTVTKAKSDHHTKSDSTTDVNNLFDGSLETYYSVNKESTAITLELTEETEIDGVSIGFFMKEDDSEKRIQKFDIAVRTIDSDWETMYSRHESSGEMGVMQHFPFTRSVKALYVKVESHGNNINNWTAFTEVEVCGAVAEEVDALFGGVAAAKKEIATLTGEVCTEPKLLDVEKLTATGDNDVRYVVDGDYQTRWISTNTQNEDDLDNAHITVKFKGDQHVTELKMAFFDGNLANQFFTLYKQKAEGQPEWEAISGYETAERTTALQDFNIQQTGVHKLFIVGNGNTVGDYNKISEIKVYGC